VSLVGAFPLPCSLHLNLLTRPYLFLLPICSANCDPRTTSQVQGCAILNTKLLVSSIGAPISKVHSDILSVLSGAFRDNSFVYIIPELLDTSFLGPDPEALTLSASKADAINGGSEVVKTWVVALSIGCSMLILIIVSMYIAFLLRSKQQKLKQMSRVELDQTLDGALVTYRDRIT
jgi:hypothetical protein